MYDSRPSVPLWFILVLFAAVAVCGLASSSMKASRNAPTAESELREWARKLGVKITGAACNAIDSDGDGYVSCSYMDEHGTRNQVECAAAWTWQHGCRDPKVHVPTPATRSKD